MKEIEKEPKCDCIGCDGDSEDDIGSETQDDLSWGSPFPE